MFKFYRHNLLYGTELASWLYWGWELIFDAAAFTHAERPFIIICLILILIMAKWFVIRPVLISIFCTHEFTRGTILDVTVLCLCKHTFLSLW